ncbi:MAG: 16S rRNA (uracil(1498)-N(3))-methyltransferase [Gammaproteobacteria bacterium]
MIRIYQNMTFNIGEIGALSPDRSHYLANVMRVKPGERCVIFNGQSTEEAIAEVKEASGKKVLVEILETQINISESPLKIHLIQGVAKGPKMDWILQKSTELGVSAITPVFTEFCDVKLDAKRAEKKLAHWQQVVVSACEQSGRAIVPTIHPPCSLERCIDQLGKVRILALEPGAPASIHDIEKPSGNIACIIGPEGGLSEKDKNTLKTRNIQFIQLGKRILRTETASIVILSLLQFLDCVT